MYHSDLKLFSGFAIDALTAWKLTASKAINKAPAIAPPGNPESFKSYIKGTTQKKINHKI
jgi:hypothetical protein